MKKWLLSLMLMTSLSAVAGNGSTGGGMGVVCKNPDGSIKSVELLDLWEARVLYGRETKISSASVADQVEEHLQNFKNAIYSSDLCSYDMDNQGHCGPEALYGILKGDADTFFSNIPGKITRLRGVTLKKTDDAFEVITPNDCEIAQLVRFQDTAHGGKVLLNQDLVDHMDTTNEAALYIHEAFYAFLRFGDKTSVRVRRAVGLSFSGHKFQNIENFLPKQYYDCHDNSRWNRVFMYVPESGLCANQGITVQVVSLARMYAMDFEQHTMCQYRGLEDVFTSQSPYERTSFLGQRTGFDYSYRVRIGGSLYSDQATLELGRTPNDQPFEKASLKCELKTRE